MSIQLQEIQSIYISQNRLVEDTRLHQIYKNKLVEGKDYMIGESIKTNDAKNNYILLKGFYPNTDTATANWNKITVTVGNGEEYFLDSGTGYHFGDCAGCCISTDNKLLLCNHINGIGHTWDNIALWRVDLSYLERGDMKLVLKRQLSKKNSISDIFWSDGSSLKPRNPNWRGNNNTTTLSMKLSAPNGFALTDCKFERDNEVYLNLVPCKLLRPIPRNLDAQCKSRQTGECGMIDLISGRFYGNISSSGTFSLVWDEWLKDCSIQIDMEQTLGITNYAPPTIVYKGRIDTTKLTSELIDFGFVKISNTQIVCNQQTWSFSNWGSNKWATIEVSYGGNGGCNVNVNGTNIGSQTTQVTGIFNPHIFLYDIVQLNKIDYTFYPVQSDPTRSVNLIFSRGVDESLGKQYMTDNDGATYRIYAD